MENPRGNDPGARALRFPKTARVVSRRDFERAYSQGLRVRGALLTVVLVENGLAHSRLGLSIGKSIWKGAVQRNRVRRIFREAFRLAQHELPSGFDVIAIAARPKLEPQLEATRSEWIALMHKGAARWRASTPEERAAARAARPKRPAKKGGKPKAPPGAAGKAKTP